MDKDYYSVDSEYLETLNTLRPPVKRLRKNNQGDYFDSNDSAKLQFGSNITKVYRQGENTKHYVKDVRSSLSLVLQKTCKKQIYKTYAYYNPECTLQGTAPRNDPDDSDKPLLKITVIPKSDPQPLIKLLENSNSVASKLKKTTVENSYQTKNLYLIVAGANKEKIYKVKTTSSTKTLRETTQVENGETLKGGSNEMEKKKNKSPKDINKNEPDCICSCKECLHGHLVEDVLGKSSRVQIFGRIGLDKNDEYVMKCAATVNGQTVPTSNLTGFQEKEENDPLDIYPLQSKLVPRIYKPSKESQATQFDINVSIPCQVKDKKDQKVQCSLCKLHDHIKVNTDGVPNIKKVNTTSSPLVIISVYPNHEINNVVVNQRGEDILTLKPQEEFRVNNFAVDAGLPNVKNNYLMYNTQTNQDETDFPTKRARSASPRKKHHKNENEVKSSNTKSRDVSPNIKTKQTSHRKKDQNLKNQSDEIPTTRNENRQQKNQNVTKPIPFSEGNKEMERKQNSQTKPQNKNNNMVLTSATYRATNMTILNKNNQRKDNNKNEAQKNFNKGPKQRNKNNITVPTLTNDRAPKTTAVNKNKQLKDNTKNEVYKASPRYQKSEPNNNVSKVLVNIDSDKEFYNVIFEKGQLNTDLYVRKKIKDQKEQIGDKYVDNFVRHTRKDKLGPKNNLRDKSDKEIDRNWTEDNKESIYYSENKYADNIDAMSDSLRNFFPGTSDQHKRRSVSQAFNGFHFSEGCLESTTEHASGVYVRDSLELNHRREDRDSNTYSEKYPLEYASTEESEEDLDTSVPTKHYTGDSCPVYNPVQRDKEIRDLLGVNTKRKHCQTTGKDNKQPQEHDGYSIDGDINVPSNQQLFHNALCKILVTNLMMRRSCSCPSCTRRKLRKADKLNIIKCLRIDNKYQLHDQDFVQIDAVVRSREELKKIEKNKIKITLMKSLSTQYESIDKIKKSLDKMKKNHFHLNVQPNSKQRTIKLTRKQYRKVKQSLRKCQNLKFRMNSVISIGEVKTKTKSNYMMYWHKEVQTVETEKDAVKCTEVRQTKLKERKDAGDSHTVVLFAREYGDNKSKNAKRTVSSVDMHITGATSVIRLKDLTGSYTNVISLGSSNQERKRRNSIETIFRDNRKSHTPNLGTSALSIQTDVAKTVSQSETLPTGSRPRKPFLKRLMSCLVMRTVRASEVKLGYRKERTPTLTSSFDSYHINTSLGAIEMGTSLYDTSDSYFTNHSVGPINSKMKRGFLSSVRGFLSSRRN